MPWLGRLHVCASLLSIYSSVESEESAKNLC